MKYEDPKEFSFSRRTWVAHPRYGSYRRRIYRREIQMAKMHDFEMTSIQGESVKLSDFQNQVCLVVNVASQ